MVRSGLSGGPRLRYGAVAMNGDTDSADRPSGPVSAADGQAGTVTTAMEPEPGRGDALSSRPWTPAAAMEPVPPLAPPPARPGSGAHVVTSPRPPHPPLGALAIAAFVAVALVLAVLMGLLLAIR
jgi:hypothetical protein